MKQKSSLVKSIIQSKKNNEIQNLRQIIIFVISTVILSLFLFSTSNLQNQGIVHINKLLYFTTQSNILIWIFYLLNCLLIFAKKTKIQKKFNNYYIRGTVTIYILITGIIFTFILYPQFIASNINNSNQISWNYQNIFFAILINLVLPHIVMPTIVFYDFWKFNFIKKPNYIISFVLFIFYPFIYLLLALIIGNHFNNTYPYFFLNLPKLGYLDFFMLLISIFTFFIIFWFLLIYRTRKKISNNYNKIFL